MLKRFTYLTIYKKSTFNKVTFKQLSVLPNKKAKKLPSFHEELEKELKPITNINSLLYFINKQSIDFLLNEHKFLRIISKYRDFDSIEPNSDIKIFVLLDMLIRKDIKYSISMIKSLMSLLFSKGIYEDVYWDFIYSQIIKENMLESEDNLIDIIKGFSIIPYENFRLWNMFEQQISERYKKLNIKDVETTILCFIIKKQGSQELLKDLIEYSKTNSNESDIIVNYTISIIKHYRNLDIYHKFIGYSIDYISEKVLKLEETKPTLHSIENIDLIYTLLPGFHKLLRKDKSYKQTERYKKDELNNFVIGIEKVIAKFIESEIHKFEEQDVIQVSNSLRYLIDYQTKFKLIKTKNILPFYRKCYKLIKNYKIMLSFLTYFKYKKVPIKYFKDVTKFETIFETFIDKIHIMTFDELYEILDFCKFYKMRNGRLFAFLQNNLLKFIFESESLTIQNDKITLHEEVESYDDIKSKLAKVIRLKDLLEDNDFYLSNDIFLPFITTVQNQQIKLEIKLSLNENVRI